MKKILTVLCCFTFFNCSSVKIEDLNFVIGRWNKIKEVNEETWLKRANQESNSSFVFYKNGDVVFSDLEQKPKKEIEEILKKNRMIYCGTGYYNSIRSLIYNKVEIKGKWIIEDKILKINYLKDNKILRKEYQIKYLTKKSLDIEEIKTN